MSIKSSVEDVTPDLARLRFLFVNMYLYGTADKWVLIDAGLKGSAGDIVDAAEARFGKGTKPEAIILTHGHFDHVGAFPALFEHWDVPIYAHRLEVSFITGQKDYLEPDPTVGKGAMAMMSFSYPHKATDWGDRVNPIPDDGTLPFMPGWRWIHVPGHTDGQVAFFREEDRLLIAGDAFVTTQQESLYEVMRQKEGIHGPPAYFTPAWVTARQSVEKLFALNPDIAATGHGPIMRGDDLRSGLANLVANFDDIALPDRGTYVPADGTKP